MSVIFYRATAVILEILCVSTWVSVQHMYVSSTSSLLFSERGGGKTLYRQNYQPKCYGEDGEQHSTSEVLKACLNSSSFFVLMKLILRLTTGEHMRHEVRGLSVVVFSKSFADMVSSNSRWP
mmetsp:Transcript_38064/g.61119  ORF Transcript_38064/g.61119 Transcript_38064/m.61119 type:complete len:122 (-) Transcript_38064:1663-2028(-)